MRVKMRDSYDIAGEKIIVSDGTTGYAFVDIIGYPSGDTGSDLVRVRIGLKGKRLRKFVKALERASED